MKKVYHKPEIQIENFVMDIAIAGSCNADVSEERKTAEEYWWNLGGKDDLADVYPSFEDYLNGLGLDSSTSAYCYFTVSSFVFS